MDKPTMWKFTCVNQEDAKTTEVTVMLPEDVCWSEVLNHFAHFLDGCGYVGVVTTLDKQGSFLTPWERANFPFKGSDVE